MSDSLRIADTLTTTGESPDQHVANAIQMLWKIRDELEESQEGLLSSQVMDFVAIERRLMVALAQLRSGQRVAEQKHLGLVEMACGELDGED